MPPRRPLPDLVLIAVFKQLKVTDQLKASKISYRCSILVRAANFKISSLVITGWDNAKPNEDRINSFSLASNLCMQKLPISDKPSVPDYPMTENISKWNCLQLEDCFEILTVSTIELILNIFPAVTDLKFVACSSEQCKNLIALLEYSNWADQLTNLLIITYDYKFSSEMARCLFAHINTLPVLKFLAIRWESDIEMPELTILNQLSIIAVQFCSIPLENKGLLRSIEQHAIENVNLHVHLHWNYIHDLLQISEHLCSRITHIGWNSFVFNDNFQLLCHRFTSLTSVAVNQITSVRVEPLFDTLSHLSQLVHLKISIVFLKKNENFHAILPRFNLSKQLSSVLALELELAITDHSQLKWLNLKWRLPNLKAIYLKNFYCESCGVSLYIYFSEICKLSPSVIQNCYNETLFNIHPGVDHSRIILKIRDNLISLEESFYRFSR